MKSFIAVILVVAAGCGGGNPLQKGVCEKSVAVMYERGCSFVDVDDVPVPLDVGIDVCEFIESSTPNECMDLFFDWTDCLKEFMPGQCYSCNRKIEAVYRCKEVGRAL